MKISTGPYEYFWRRTVGLCLYQPNETTLMWYSGGIIPGDPSAPTFSRLTYICVRSYHYQADGAGDGSEPNLSPVLE